jgi:hypothetical protein
MRFVSFLLLFFCLIQTTKAVVVVDNVAKKSNSIFAGRVAKINKEAGLVRVKVDFTNMKYINKRDSLEFWDQRNSSKRCKAYVAGKSNDYLLLKIPEFVICERNVYVSNGVYLMFDSVDLSNNLKMGSELVEILLKKKLGLQGQLMHRRQELDSHLEKVNAVNLRYQILREKLESDWRNEIAALEEDRVVSLRNYKDLEIRLAELDGTLERYRIDDDNLGTDRWALDPRLYYKK